MGKHIGELGQRRDTVVDLTFDWFGETMRVGPDAHGAALGFFERAATIDIDKQKPRALLASRDFLRKLVHGEDWPRFVELAEQNHLEVVDLLVISNRIVEAVVEEAARFPIGPPSGSTPGRASTAVNSKGGYSSHVAAALAQAKGRPDIKRMILRAHQARKEAALAA